MEMAEIPVDETELPPPAEWKRGFADFLTLLRAVLTPVIMLVIVLGWSVTREPGDYEMFTRMLEASVLATVLFGLAAMTDALDDAVGGAEMAGYRRFGWFDDVADTILVDGTLLALLYVTWTSGALGLGLLVPVALIVGRDVLIAALKGYELSRTGWPQTAWGTAKNALAMAATLVLVASPWLTNAYDKLRVGDDPAAVFGEPSNLVWNIGLFGLWATAILSVVTGVMLITRRPAQAATDTETRGG